MTEGKEIKKARERKRDSIQSAEALTQRSKSPTRKPLTTSTGWKKNRLREPKRGYVGRFSPFSLSLPFSYSIFPSYFLSLVLRPVLSAFVNVSPFLRLLPVSTTCRFHYKTDSSAAPLAVTSTIRNPFPRPVNRIATFRGIWRDHRAAAKARG